MSDATEGHTPPARPLWMDALHVFALCGLAVAQPLFDIIQKNATFFIAHGTDAVGVIAFAVALILVPPALVMAPLLLVRVVSRRAYRVLHTAAIGALVGLIMLPFMTSAGASSVITAIVFLIATIVAAIAYERLGAARRYGTVLAVAPIILVLLFLVFSPVRSLLGGGTSEDRTTSRSGTGAPIVMLLMDEFSLGSILTPDGEIDETRFPNFARLADRSTWYPNATTNANATHIAFPTIMTGKYPRTNALAPVHSSYPDNLFSLLGPTYDTKVDEWVTALCSFEACRERAVSYSSKHLTADTALIYLHLVLPPRLKKSLPPLGHQWAGFFANPADNAQRLRQIPRTIRPVAARVMDWLSDDEFSSPQLRRFEIFLRSIGSSKRPTFSFLHVGLPHSPWHLLPNATVYDRQHTPGLDRTALRWLNSNFADAALQRYMLQVKGTDHLIGELIDRLDAEGLWDDSLVVAMADHGITFEAGHTTRAIVGLEGDLLPIPLFVKYPDQRRGKVDRRNAETIDVFPTIADVAGIDVPGRIDGVSLAGPDPRRPTKRAWAGARQLRSYDADIARRKTGISERIRGLFGKGGRRGDLFGFGPHRDLIGSRLDDLSVAQPSNATRAAIEQADRWTTYDRRSPYVPARVTGVLSRPAPGWVAVAVNGRVAGFGRPWNGGGRWLFDVMISDAYLEPGRNKLELFGVTDDDQLIAVDS